MDWFIYVAVFCYVLFGLFGLIDTGRYIKFCKEYPTAASFMQCDDIGVVLFRQLLGEIFVCDCKAQSYLDRKVYAAESWLIDVQSCRMTIALLPMFVVWRTTDDPALGMALYLGLLVGLVSLVATWMVDDHFHPIHGK